MVEANIINKKQVKSLLDIKITDIKKQEGTSFFVIKLTKLNDQANWNVEKRYTNFADLHTEMVALGYRDLPKFPQKQLFMSSAAISARKGQLEKYLMELVDRKDTINSGPVIKFLALAEFA